MAMTRPVYLVDFAAYKPPEELRVSKSYAEEHAKGWPMYSPEMRDFLVKVLEKSGINPEGTYLPPSINPCVTKNPDNSIDHALLEAKMVMTSVVEEVLGKAGLKPTDIDILVTNSSIFCPTPCLSSLLVNHFKMRSDIESYNLGGMGCGNGVVSLGLIRNLLQSRPNVTALFVPAEITTYCFYPGREKFRMVANAIFRMGGAAILMTNKPSARHYAKYVLEHHVRVHTGSDDDSYGCMGWGPDAEGINGVYLRKTVPAVAGKALELALRSIAPKILSWGQYGEAAYNAFERVLLKRDVPEYQPDFTRCVDHFALHAGGYAVLKSIQAAMKLPAESVLPSFAALRDYGNTSCSTTWYVMACLESEAAGATVKRGQTILQAGMGGGMKVGVAVWRALRDNRCIHPAWRHRAGNPITLADLPRAVDEDSYESAGLARKAAPPAAVAAHVTLAPAAVKQELGAPLPLAAAGAHPQAGVPAGGKAVQRRLTVEVACELLH